MNPALPPPPDVAARLAFLRSAAAPGAPAGGGADLRLVETHMSWVLLAGRRVYKLKKPLRHDHHDASTPSARLHACREELRVNARLAPGMYLGVLVMQWDGHALSLVPDAERHLQPGATTVDAVVLMRRLPQARMLDRLIAEGRLATRQLDALVRVLAGFYRGAAPVALAPAQHVARLRAELQADARVLTALEPLRGRSAAVLARAEAACTRHEARLRARAAQGRIVEGHGDLRPEHVCMLRRPLVIDALEFDARLREVDPLDELAGLALECELAGAAWVGPRLIGGCAAALSDVADPPLLALYTLKRALLRARLAMAHLLDPQPRTPERWPALAERHLARAEEALRVLEPAHRHAPARSADLAPAHAPALAPEVAPALPPALQPAVAPFHASPPDTALSPAPAPARAPAAAPR